MNLQAGIAALLESPLYGITLTLGVYWLAQQLWLRTGRHPSMNPVFMAMVAGALVVWALGTPYEQYMNGGQYIGFLLGPATVALALPIYRQRERINRAAPMIVFALLVGSVVAIASGYWFTRWLGGTHAMALSMAPKSATTPISIALAEQLGGIPPLTAIFTIVAGVIGAVVGPALLRILRIRDPRAQGLAMGLSSHGVGTARALEIDETMGAFSGVGMALNGLVTSLLIGGVLALVGAA